MTRALGVIRLSELTDESTSPERQREIITRKAAERGSEIIGWAEDLDVSASKVAPMNRPQLRVWLDRPDEYDELIFWRIDRLARKVGDFARMVEWCEEQGKGLVSATEAFDLADKGLGQAMAYIAVTFAQMEANANSVRVTGSHAYLRRNGRFGGGKAPYGYQAILNGSGAGYVLAYDEEAAEIVREIVGRVIAGEAVNAIAADLTRRGYASPRDRTRILAGREPWGDPWQPGSLRKVLANPAMLGYATHDKQAVTGDDGMPIMKGPPIVTESEWDRLQHALSVASRVKARTQTPSLLLGIAYCGKCGGPYYKWQKPNRHGKVYSYYRCRNSYRRHERPTPCDVLHFRCDDLDQMTADSFLGQVGDLEVLEKVYIAGVDHSDEIAQLRRAVESARAEYDKGGYDYPGGDDDYEARAGRLRDRLTRLAAEKTKGPGYDYRPIGKTYQQLWEASDIKGRRQIMLGAGYEVRADRSRDGGVRFGFQLDPELERRVREARGGPGHEVVQDAWDAPATWSRTFGSVAELAAWAKSAVAPEGRDNGSQRS
jgi:DNA invertase Pin-like site-specific DNA recombinase